MALPPLVLRIYADSRRMVAGITQAQTKLGKLQAFAKGAGKILAISLGVVAVGGAIKAVQAAGDLGEAINAANVTFGRSTGIVRRWARQAANSAGLAESTALQATAGLGAMFDSAGIAAKEAANMSVSAAQLAADLGSLRNADPSEMLERMRAGLSGEAEPLRRFGIFLSEARVQQEALRMGLAETGEELTDAQKIQARYNIILEDAAEAQGDFARTAGESLPNQLRKLRANFENTAASIGNALLPMVVSLLGWINDSLIPAAKNFAHWFGENVAPALRKVGRFIANDVIPALVTLWEDHLRPFVNKVAPLVVNAVGAIRGEIESWADAIGTVIQKWQELDAWLDAHLPSLPQAPPGVIPGHSGLPGTAPPFGDIPGRQHGGSVMAGMPYIVGEKGRELFVPRVSGHIVPNGEGGGISLHFHGPVYGFDDFERRVEEGLANVVRRAASR